MIVNTFTYNADGPRVKIENNEGTSKIIWDGQQYLAETDGSDTTTVAYTNTPAAFTNLISQRKDGTTIWLHFDALGSMRQATNISEIVTDTAIYDAWENIVSQTGTTPIVFLWNGQHGYFYNIDTGDHYVIERIDDPVTARWMSLEPIVFSSATFTD